MYIRRILDSLHSNAIVRRATYVTNGTENKEKNDRKKMRRRKETPWRHRPETERFQMRRKREDREHERGITDEHPRCRPHYQRAVTQSLQIRCFAICQPASMRDTVQYDITRDELCYFETARKSPAIMISQIQDYALHF